MPTAVRPEGYPKFNITFKIFCEQLKACFTIDTFKNNELNDYYIAYKEAGYRSNIDWVLKNGYESVPDFCRWFFQDWNVPETGTELKPEYRDDKE